MAAEEMRWLLHGLAIVLLTLVGWQARRIEGRLTEAELQRFDAYQRLVRVEESHKHLHECLHRIELRMEEHFARNER